MTATIPPQAEYTRLAQYANLTVGTGNPNGVVTGSLNQIQYDSVGKVFYLNTDGGTTWVVQ